MAAFLCYALPPSSSSPPYSLHRHVYNNYYFPIPKLSTANAPQFLTSINHPNPKSPIVSCSSYPETPSITTTSHSDTRPSSNSSSSSSSGSSAPPLLKKRKRYRRAYPGETKGITEEMRFVAMRLRNSKIADEEPSNQRESDGDDEVEEDGGGVSRPGDWQPSIEGFLKYLVDSKLVFDTVERIVEESNDVSYAYFRRTGLERSASLVVDLEWFGQKGILIPEPSNPGLSYANYLEQLAEKNAPLFLCHLYNIYFAHIAGDQMIAKQVSDKLLDGRQLEFFTWEGDPQVMLKDVREKLNRLAEYWSRDDRNKCLKETTKSFRHLGQIVRLIIL